MRCWRLLYALLVALLPGASSLTPAQLNDTTACDASGFGDLTPYQQRLDLLSPYNVSANWTYFLPLYASRPLAVRDTTVVSVAVFLHGLNANANAYYCTGAAAVQAAGRASDVLSLAPWFGNEQVLASEWGEGGDDAARSAFWDTTRWLNGGNASPGDGPSGWTTAFDVLDALVANLNSGVAFPNLKLITFVGFSAGAQLASRYAWATPLSAGVRFLVSDPGTLLYLDNARPAPSCRPLYDTGSTVHCDNFTVPSPVEDCDSDYNTYKYGVQQGSLGSANAYLAPMDTDPTLITFATTRFEGKDVVYVFGSEDSCNCGSTGFDNGEQCFPADVMCVDDAGLNVTSGCCDTYPDGLNNALDFSCAASVQGSNRLQRGLLYMLYLQSVYGISTPAARFFVIDMAHNNSVFYASAPFREWAFYAAPSGGSSGWRRGAAIGGALGGAAALLLAGLLLRRRWRRAQQPTFYDAEETVEDSMEAPLLGEER